MNNVSFLKNIDCLLLKNVRDFYGKLDEIWLKHFSNPELYVFPSCK